MNYLEGTLDRPVRQVFEAHIADCTNCWQFLKSYRDTLDLGQSRRRPDVDRSSAPRVPAASGSTGPDWEISGTGPPLEKALRSFAFTMAQGIACTSARPGSLALWWHQGDPTRGHSLSARVLARF